MTSVHEASRAAFKTRLLGTALATAAGLFTASGRTLVRGVGSFRTEGFRAGDYVTLTGSGLPNAGVVLTRLVDVEDLQLTVEASLPNVTSQITVTARLPAAYAWEGFPFRVTAGSPYVSESMLTPVSSVASVGGGPPLQRHSIIHTATLFYPALEGPYAVERAAAAIMIRFRPGTQLSAAPKQVVVERCERRQLQADAEWNRLPVLVTCVAYST